MKKIYMMILGLSMGMVACMNNDYLEYLPKDKQTVETVFTNYDGFKTYSWGLYDVFLGYSGTSPEEKSDIIFKGDYDADNMINAVDGKQSPWAAQTVSVPAEDTSWDYAFIRQVNLMLDQIDDAGMAETDKAHWRSVGYFFRAYKYFDMMSKFGDIPWVEHVLNEDSPELYMERTPRTVVADSILNQLKYAEMHIKPNGDGPNTVNKTVVQSLLSRFALFEGTWRKYHGMQNAEKFLSECVRASEAVMAAFPKLNPKYYELFNSENLNGVSGIILYKEYKENQMGHSLTRKVKTQESFIEATKDVVDSYLCADGKPISTSSLYQGDADMYHQFKNRDYRLYQTVCPPYKVSVNADKVTFRYTDDPKDREFMDLMATISDASNLSLPSKNFKGFLVSGQPHFRNYNWGQGWNASYLGYWVWKYYNSHTPADANENLNTTDAPLFRVGEIMLNYAEAKAEQGSFTQADADKTINKLRDRAHVAHMNVAEINETFDTKRDASVSPLLWEIRRERRVELMGEGFRLNDLRRWKKGEYLNKQPLGVHVTNPAEYGNKLKLTAGGFSYFFPEPLGWKDYYYLYPIPVKQITLSKGKIVQNPGWTVSPK